MSFFACELKKIFSKRLIWVILGLFLLLDLVKIGMVYQDVIAKDPLSKGRQALIDEIKGPITHDNLNFVIDKKRDLDALVADRAYQTSYDSSTYTGYQFGDSIVFNEIYEELDYAYHYADLLEKVQTKAAENLTLYPESSYEAKRSQKILDRYQDREITNYYDTTGYEAFFSYDFSTLLILSFLLFALTPLFAEESESGMNLLILSTPKGSGTMTRAKLSAAVTTALGSTLLFILLDLLLFVFLFRLEGGRNPLYSIQSFAYTSFNGSITQYVFLSICLKLIGSIFFSLLYLLFSATCVTVLPALMGGGGVLLLLVFGNDFVPVSWLRQLSPLSLFTNRILFQEFAQISCFKTPIDGVYLLLAAIVALSGIMLILIWKLQSRASAFRQKHRGKTI